MTKQEIIRRLKSILYFSGSIKPINIENIQSYYFASIEVTIKDINQDDLKKSNEEEIESMKCSCKEKYYRSIIK